MIVEGRSNLMRIFGLSIIINLLFFFISCSKGPDTTIKIENVILKEKLIEIKQTKVFEGWLNGVDFENNQFFLTVLNGKKGVYEIRIGDIKRGEIVKTVDLRKGSFQSPTDIYSPTYIQRINDKYILVDQSDKIMAFDKDFKWLYTSMFHHFRYFIDFYKKSKQIFFVFGKTNHSEKVRKYKIELYEFLPKERIKFIKRLQQGHHPTPFNLMDRTRIFHIAPIWAKCSGFEKEAKIHFSDGKEKKYSIYDLSTNKMITYELSYLGGKKYSVSDNKKVNNYIRGDFLDRLSKKTGFKLKFYAYPDEIYHFGIYDVGKDKIGIVGDLNLNNMTFRLDIIDLNSFEYIESIWLPIDWGFAESIQQNTRGFLQSYINIDKGIHLYTGDDEDRELFVYLNKFIITKDN